MSDNRELTREVLCEKINAVKKTAYTKDVLADESYLGGDLGIDSIEMLEIWFHVESQLGAQIGDEAKRDVYTIGQVLDVVSEHLTEKM